ncbi:MAG: Actin-related protein 3B [Paramarteilia canceri]
MASFFDAPAVVIDLGTSSVKLGRAGNLEPQAIIPSYIGIDLKPNMFGTLQPQGLEDVLCDVSKGVKQGRYDPVGFMDHGIISNFDYFSTFINRIPYSVMNYDTRTCPILITEPVTNPPENRESIGEICFETMDCPALTIQKQPICSIISNLNQNVNKSITGLVIDSGDGATQLTPVYDGFAILSQVTQIPMAGKDMTYYIAKVLREREKIPSGVSFEIATKYKEDECYVCQDPIKEFSKYDSNPSENFLKLSYKASDGKTYSFTSGHERFMAPESFFSPDIINPELRRPLNDLIVETIANCPVDTRRSLFSNISLSGGSTMYKNFDKRVKIETQQILNDKIEKNYEQTGYRGTPMEVIVPKDKLQKYRVFAGASLLANTLLV